jgi:hypothetical protein
LYTYLLSSTELRILRIFVFFSRKGPLNESHQRKLAAWKAARKKGRKKPFSSRLTIALTSTDRGSPSWIARKKPKTVVFPISLDSLAIADQALQPAD